jgi:hypothetical protein
MRQFFSHRWRWSGPTMRAARGLPAAAACAPCSGSGGGRRRLTGLGGPKGRMGWLTIGPIGPKVEGKIASKSKLDF